MPAPGGSFVPTPKFAFPRSYIAGIGVQIVSGVITHDGNGNFTLTNAPLDANVYHFSVDTRFWEWSSNGWTLDWLISDSYYYINGIGLPIEMPYLLTVYPRIEHTGGWIIYSPFSSPGDVTWFTLPPAPPTYWLPTPT